MHLCAEISATPWMLEPFGEVGTIFSLKLSSQTYFAKIKNIKVIAENQFEKHKKSSLIALQTFYKGNISSHPEDDTYEFQKNRSQ